MHLYYLLIVILLLITVFSYANFKWIRLPGPIAITLLSLITSLVLLLFNRLFPEALELVRQALEGIPFFDLVIKIVLGLILFAGAYRTSFNEIKGVIKSVLTLAFISTILSTLLVGMLMHYGLLLFSMNVPLVYCFLFGALISPTDPVAVLGILHKAGVEKSLELKLTGESLINDGVGIVLFVTFYQLYASAETLEISTTILLFLKEAGGGVLFGLLLGSVGLFMLRTVKDYKIAILVTLVIAMPGYTAADLLGISGPIAMVAAGLIMGNAERSSVMKGRTKRITAFFWELVDNFFNSMLFLLIGFEFVLIPLTLEVFVIGLMAVLIVLASRFLSVVLPALALRRQLGSKSIALLTWCGLRGAVAIALALALPPSIYRYLFLAVTYVVALFSILVQGLTIKKLAKKL